MLQEIGDINSELRSILVHIKKEKISLSLENRPLETFMKIVLVMTSLRLVRRVSRTSEAGVLSIALLNNTLMYSREFWYMSLIRAISAITKYNILPRTATLW